MVEKMDYMQQLRNNEAYIEALKIGLIKPEDYKEITSEEAFNRTIEELNAKLKENTQAGTGGSTGSGEENEENVAKGEEKTDSGKVAEDKEKTDSEKVTEGEGKADSEKVAEGEENQDSKKSLVVDSEEKGIEKENTDWIEEKRRFWREYAVSIQHTFANNPEQDTSEKSFSCTLSKDNLKGDVKYTSPKNAQISKESHLEMYQGLVKDAVKNNLTITFGNSLDDKQKAMLLAACIMNKENYADGTKLEMVNPPKIDMNAQYFKELPEEVQKAIGGYLSEARAAHGGKQEEGQEEPKQSGDKKEEVQKRLEEVRAKLEQNKELKGGSAELTKIREEQRQALQDLVDIDPAERYKGLKDREAVEQIHAARLGIIPSYETENKIVYTKDRKDNDVWMEKHGFDKNNLEQNATYRYLSSKYRGK